MAEQNFRVRKGITVDGTGDSSIAGNLGIGTTSPVSLLHLEKTAYDFDDGTQDADGDFHLMLKATEGSTSGDAVSIGFAQSSDATTVGAKISHVVENSFSRGSLVFSTNNTASGGDTTEERMRITGGGDVGIGTSSPAVPFHVAGGNNEAARFEGSANDAFIKILEPTGSENVVLGSTGGTGFVGSASNNNFAIRANNSNKMFITPAGNVGIGTSSPSTELDVNGTVTATAFAGEVQPKATTAAAGNNTTDYYAKLLTFNPGGSTVRDCNLILGVTSFSQGGHGSAIISVKFRSNGATAQYTVDVAFMSKAGTSLFDQDAFQIFSDGNLVAQDNNTDIELWVKKNGNYYAVQVHELSKSMSGGTTSLTYHTNSAWQSSAPTNNALTTTTQGIELNLDIVRVGVAAENTYMYLHPSVSNSLLYASSSGDVSLLADDDLTLHADDDMFFQAGGATKMTLLDSGNLGIGTTSPAFPLHLKYTDNDTAPEGGSTSGSGTIGANAEGGGLYIENASTTDGSYAGITFRTDTADARIAYQSVGSSLTNEGQMSFYLDTNDTDGGSPDAVFTLEEVLRLRGGSSDSDSNQAFNSAYVNGRLGVGTASPSSNLHVKGGSGEAFPLILERPTTGGANFGVGMEFTMGDADSATAGHIYGRIIACMDGASGNVNGSEDGYLRFDTSLNGSATEAMRILSSGNVGIGTTSPETLLHLDGTTGQIAQIGTGNSTYGLHFADDRAIFGHVGGFATVQGGLSKAVRFCVNNGAFGSGEVARFDTSGNFGIGTTGPDAKLHVEGSVLIDAYEVGEDAGLFFREGFLTTDQPSITVWDMSNSGASPDGLSINANDGIRFRENGGEVARFKDGSLGIGTTSPSTKLDVNGTVTATGLNLQNGSLDYGGGKQQSGDLAVGWYTFAVCKGRDATTSAQRAFGEFLINDVDSGRHGSCRLNATHFFGAGNSIQVFAYNFYSTAVFDELRIKESGTYAGAALQVYVSNAENNLESYMTMSEQNQSWELLDTWLADSDDSGHNAILGYASHSQDWSGFAAAQRIDLSIFDVSQGGIYTTGGMYAEELELKDATGITIQTREDLDLTSAGGTDTSNQRHKRIFATTSNDGSPFDEVVYYSRGSTGGWSGQHTFTVDKSGTSGTGYEALRIRDSGNGTSSEVLVSHKLGVGILDPVPMLHIFADNATTNQTTSGAASITIENDGAGDAALNFLLTGTRRWIMGIDNSDSDKFKISTGGTDIGTGTKLTIDSSGNTTVSGGLGAPSASITNQLTAGSTSVGSYQNVTTSDAITQNGVAINGTNTTNVRAEGNTFAFSTSHILAGNLTSGSEVELFRFNITNNSYRKFQAGRMFIRVQDTATSCFMQQSVTFGVTGTADVLQSTTDRLDSSIVSSASTAQQAWTDEKATIVVSLVSDYVCVKFKNETGSTIGTSGFSARLSCELFEQDALPS